MYPEHPEAWADHLAQMIPHSVQWFDGAWSVWLEGPHRFQEEVAGESFCQPHLEFVTGKAALRETGMALGAWLKPEIDNPADPTAVLVWIRGSRGGLLPRARAAFWARRNR